MYATIAPRLRALLRNTVLATAALVTALPAVPAAAGPLSWLASETKGSGTLARQTREPGPFSAVALSMGGAVELRLGNTESVTVEVDDNILPLVETVVENGTLRIRPTQRNARLDTRKLKVVVQARNIERITVAGSGNVNAQQLRAPQLDLEVGGSGNITLQDVTSEAISVAIGGSGNLKAGGTVERLRISIGGSGRVHTEQLAARTASVSIGGSGTAVVWAKQTLGVSVAGSGDVSYYGDPKLNTSITGSGRVHRLGVAPQ